MSEAASRPRSDAIDIARGLSLLAMAAYHFVWDLTAFSFVRPGVPFTPPMRFASMAIGSAFLALVGLSLALAHPGRPRWGAFFRRIGIVAAAAALVSLVSLFAEPQAPIGFGILHCISVASLLAAPLFFLAGWFAIVLGVAAILAPMYLSSTVFDPAWLVWTGLATHEPLTVDWRPLLPWGGVVWLSFGLARMAPASIFVSAPFRWRASSAPLRSTAWLGRHSLAFYLLHQPVLYALTFAASSVLGVADERQREAIVAQCRPACVESGGAPDDCARACACVAERVVKAQRSSSAEDASRLASACAVDKR